VDADREGGSRELKLPTSEQSDAGVDCLRCVDSRADDAPSSCAHAHGARAAAGDCRCLGWCSLACAHTSRGLSSVFQKHLSVSVSVM